jgi:hypothetical protein
MTYTIQIAEGTFLDTKTIKRVTVGGIEFDETFLSNLVIKHLKDFQTKDRRTFSDAFDCSGRSNTDPPCRFNIDPGRIVAFALGNCG